jgi:RimJ/RimL family protein N-acetyltransferase
MVPVPDYRIDCGDLLLRLAQRQDLPGLMALHCDDEVNRYLPYVTWQGPADADRWFDKVVARHREGSAVQLVICQQAEVLGTAILFGFEQENGRAELGYALKRSCWGRGVMTRTLPTLLQFCFDELQLRRLDAEVDPRNQASCRLLQRVGFRQEGLQRQRRVVKGELRDAALFGLLRQDWAGQGAPGGENGSP